MNGRIPFPDATVRAMSQLTEHRWQLAPPKVPAAVAFAATGPASRRHEVVGARSSGGTIRSTQLSIKLS